MENNKNMQMLTNEELLSISAGSKCTWKKALAEGAGGAIIGSLGGPWGAAAGGAAGVANCYLDALPW